MAFNVHPMCRNRHNTLIYCIHCTEKCKVNPINKVLQIILSCVYSFFSPSNSNYSIANYFTILLKPEIKILCSTVINWMNFSDWNIVFKSSYYTQFIETKFFNEECMCCQFLGNAILVWVYSNGDFQGPKPLDVHSQNYFDKIHRWLYL